MPQLSDVFPRYTAFDPLVPVYCVTPREGRVFHRFFDTSPFSPSGRYMALFRMPREDAYPRPGETGEIVLVDLLEGQERVVAETRGWEPQMGANIGWGADDTALFFNDVETETWEAFAVRLNPLTGEKQRLEGGVYYVSPNGRHIASSRLTSMRRTQEGYGVVIPDERVPRNAGLSDEDGLYVTDTETGECRMVLSIRECVEKARPRSPFNDLENHEFYGFHCKWNPQGTRMIWTIRSYPTGMSDGFDMMRQGGLRFEVYTLTPDGGEVFDAVPMEAWDKGGHHINWFPDGENLSMNLNIDGDGMRFVQCRYDGTGLRKILDNVYGSGHPTIHPNGRHILTDTYVRERKGAFGEPTPLRLVDRQTGDEKVVVRINTIPKEQKGIGCLRIDPHPAWDRTNGWVALNGAPEGTRRVYVADMRSLVE